MHGTSAQDTGVDGTNLFHRLQLYILTRTLHGRLGLLGCNVYNHRGSVDSPLDWPWRVFSAQEFQVRSGYLRIDVCPGYKRYTNLSFVQYECRLHMSLWSLLSNEKDPQISRGISPEHPSGEKYGPIPPEDGDDMETSTRPPKLDSGGGQKDRKSVFFSYEEGVYMTYTSQEIKINVCRVVMKFLIIVGLFLTYYMAWGFCDYCILAATGASCGCACSGATWLFPSCWAGILASLLRGFRLGNEIATVNIHWKV